MGDLEDTLLTELDAAAQTVAQTGPQAPRPGSASARPAITSVDETLPRRGPRGQSSAAASPGSADAAPRSSSVEETLPAAAPEVRGRVDGEDATMLASPGEAPGRSDAATHRAVVGDRRRVPTRIGRYLVIERLGEGGMGVVFAAYDPQLDRKVAIKLVRPAYTETSGGEAQARLLREAQALARLRHPNIVQVYEVGAFGDEVFVAMEFVDGVTLRTWQFEHARSWREILKVYQAAGRGLAAAHGAGLVHRDFKPDNVLVTPDGEARVLDFGLAARGEPPTPASVDLSGDDAPVDLTMTGALVGTPAYMSPEQHRGEAADVRSDVFAFSVSLFEALYGIRPFAGNSLTEICASIFTNQLVTPPPFVKIPAWLRRTIYRGLRIDPAGRPQDMEAMLRALGRDPARYLAVAGVLLVFVAIIGGLVLALRTAEGRQSLRDQGARARADFDHARAMALEDALRGRRERSSGARYASWVAAAAGERLGTRPAEALAALRNLEGAPIDDDAFAHARAVASEAIARGIPSATWRGEAPVSALVLRDRWVVSGDAAGGLAVRDLEAPARGVVAALPEGAIAAAIDDLDAAVVDASAGASAGASASERPPLRVVAVAGGELLRWDVAAGELVRDGDATYLSAAIAPGGERFAGGGDDGRLRITAWTGEAIHVYPTHAAPVTAVAFGSDGETLASGADDGRVMLWKLANGTHLEFGGLRSAVRDLHVESGRGGAARRVYATTVRGEASAWAADGASAAAVELGDAALLRTAPRVRLRLRTDGRLSLRYDDPADRELPHDRRTRAADLASDGQRLALARGSVIELWDARARRGEALPEAGQRLRELRWSPDRRWLAGAAQDGALYLWDVGAGQRSVLRAAGPRIEAMAFVGDALVTTDGAGEVLAWALAGGVSPEARRLPTIASQRQLQLLPLADDAMMVWSRDSPFDAVMIVGVDGEERLLADARAAIHSAAISGDGERLIFASTHGEAELWRLAGGELRREPYRVGGDDHRWLGIAFAADGGSARLAAAVEGDDDGPGDLVVWELDWSGGTDHLPTRHVLYEESEVRGLLSDPRSAAVLVRAPSGDRIWDLRGGVIHPLPVGLAEIVDFALADDRPAAILIGNDRGAPAGSLASVVDLRSGAAYELRTHGDVWAWDGDRRFVSAHRGVEPQVWRDPTPSEREGFFAWLKEHTAADVALRDLLPGGARAR
ncbi:MAG: serine/threonine-protein kinase [Nannocystaceae bacterium]